jgi:predicted RNase H-like HicB family nuclease
MNLHYTITMKRDEDGDVVARVQELAGCIAHGETEAEAIAALKETQRLWIEEALESGTPIPEPEADEELPSGKWLQRSPRSLHLRLSKLAKREGVSLNQLVTSMLAEATAMWNRDRTEPRECEECPLNRSEIWDRALEGNPAWKIEAALPPQTARSLDSLKRLFAKSRFGHADKTDDEIQDAGDDNKITTWDRH